MHRTPLPWPFLYLAGWRGFHLKMREWLKRDLEQDPIPANRKRAKDALGWDRPFESDFSNFLVN